MKKANNGSSFGSNVALVAVLAGVVLGAFGVFTAFGEMFDSDEVPNWIGVVAIIGLSALVLAFASVVRDRFKEIQQEDMRDVEL